MIKELILTTMFSFAPLINGVNPSKVDVFFSSSDSETSEEVVTLDDGKTYRKVYDAQSNDVTSNDDLIDGNAYRFNLFDFTGEVSFYDCGLFDFSFHQYGDIYIQNKNNPYRQYFSIDDLLLDSLDTYYFNGYLYCDSSNYSSHLSIYLKQNLSNDESSLFCGFLWEDIAEYSYSEFDFAYLYLIFDFTQISSGDDIGIIPEYFFYFFENAGDNLPYHYEEIVKGNSLFDIINDWFYSLFNNETLDNYKFTLFGKEVSMTQYLCNVATIITLVSLVIAVVSITIFIFKLSAGLFKW